MLTEAHSDSLTPIDCSVLLVLVERVAKREARKETDKFSQ